tara:strand:- start:334 stop:888 length:555 start_codon:yes stop_codon:yes gene_type:complete
MNKIYLEISKLSGKFIIMSYGLVQNETQIKDAVQELMLYFLQMNPEQLRNIWEKDGKEGIIKYGAVVLKRSYTSVRSPFYYKYKKYYRNLISMTYTSSSTQKNYNNSIYNLPNEKVDTNHNDKLELIEKELDKMCWYDKKIFQLYYSEGNTLDSLAKKTGISRNSLFTTIDKVRDILKEELSDE